VKTYRNSIIVLLVGCCFATNAVADDYNYEFGLSYGMGKTDAIVFSTLNGVPMPSLGVTTSSSDSDNLDFSGAWYYSGLSDTDTLKSRSVFLNRASSISVGYLRVDESGSFAFTGAGNLPPASSNTDTTINQLSADLRHVWRDSGWYTLAGISRAETKFDSAVAGVVIGSSEFDLTTYMLGVGKYLGKRTAVDLSITEADTEGFTATSFALSFSHIGSIGETWQYGADVGLASSDVSGDDGSYSLRGSLYPSPDFEFGIGISRQNFDSGFELDTIAVFASWFVRDNIELMTEYQQDDDSTGLGVVDNDMLVFAVRVRF